MDNVIHYADAETGKYIAKIEDVIAVTNAPADPDAARWNGVTWEYPMRYLADPDTGQFVGQDNAPAQDGQVWSDTAPPDPARHHRLIDGVWDFDADLDLAEKRSLAEMEKGAFCLALGTAEILPASEVGKAARGDWPASFSDALTGMTQAESMAAEVKWASAQSVSRTDPLLAALAAFANLDDTAVDALFGIT